MVNIVVWFMRSSTNGSGFSSIRLYLVDRCFCRKERKGICYQCVERFAVMVRDGGE